MWSIRNPQHSSSLRGTFQNRKFNIDIVLGEIKEREEDLPLDTRTEVSRTFLAISRIFGKDIGVRTKIGVTKVGEVTTVKRTPMRKEVIENSC